MDDASQIPVLKIGAVIVASHQSPVASKDTRSLETGDRGLETSILILQPIPKRAGEVPAFVLPRGSRQYQDADGNWHDARDAETGLRFHETLEPFARGLAREVEEEAGVTPAMLAAAQVRALGSRMFQSRTKGVYPIHWFVVQLDENAAQQVMMQKPIDALSVRWATLAEIKDMAARGEFSAGYVPVIEEALRAQI